MFFARATRQPHFEDAARDFMVSELPSDISAEMHDSHFDLMPSEILSLIFPATKTLVSSIKHLHEVDT